MQLIMERWKSYIKEEDLLEARPYLSMYAKKSSWFMEPKNFSVEYQDWNQFLDETHDKKISTDWIDAGSAGEMAALMGYAGIPAQARHYFDQKAHNLKKWWNETFPTFRKLPGLRMLLMKFVNGKASTPYELYNRYSQVLQKGEDPSRTIERAKDAEVQALQFILEYEYEAWKASKQKALTKER